MWRLPIISFVSAWWLPAICAIRVSVVVTRYSCSSCHSCLRAIRVFVSSASLCHLRHLHHFASSGYSCLSCSTCAKPHRESLCAQVNLFIQHCYGSCTLFYLLSAMIAISSDAIFPGQHVSIIFPMSSTSPHILSKRPLAITQPVSTEVNVKLCKCPGQQSLNVGILIHSLVILIMSFDLRSRECGMDYGVSGVRGFGEIWEYW